MPAAIKKILVPVDGSASANRAAEFASRLAADTGAVLTLLFTFEPAGPATIGLTSLSKQDVKRAVDGVAEKAMARAIKAVSKAGIAAVQQVALGNPAAEIIAAAKKDKASLIVMGSRGLSPMKGLLLGSVSEKVLRHADCAVTIVR